MSIVVGRQPFASSPTAVTDQMIETGLFEEVAREFGYDLTIDWRDFQNAGPIMELLKVSAEDMTFAFVGDSPVITGIGQGLPLQLLTTGEGNQPFYLLVRPGSDIKTLADLEGKTIGTIVGLAPQKAFFQALEYELGKTAEEMNISFVNFAEFGSLIAMPEGIDAAAMVPWIPSYISIAQGHSEALLDTNAFTGPAHELGEGERLPGVSNSPYSPEGYYQYRAYWIAHSDIMEQEPDLILAWFVAYQRALDQILELGDQAVAERTEVHWQQPPAVGVEIINDDVVWTRGWIWQTEGDLLPLVCGSKSLVAAGQLPSELTWEVMKEHLAPIAQLQEQAREITGTPVGDDAFEVADSEILDLRGLPLWRMDEWGRYTDRC
jgi:hypothetical protein